MRHWRPTITSLPLRSPMPAALYVTRGSGNSFKPAYAEVGSLLA
jgi:hypothetical protein